SFDVCSAREILEERACGCVVDGRDFARFWRAAEELRDDPERRRCLATRGASSARELFSPNSAVASHVRLYSAALRARSRTAKRKESADPGRPFEALRRLGPRRIAGRAHSFLVACQPCF